jgi:hypothetical protein
MIRTTLLIPLAASLMLGTAAYAQDQQTNGQQMPQQQPAPQNDMQNDMQNHMQHGMQKGMMMNGMMDPRQSTAGGMPIDQETSVNGIEAACTGVGDQQENRARWSSYPVKLVVAGDRGQYYAGEHVSVTGRDGRPVADMTCNGPWVLMKLEPGAYKATVDLPGHAAKTISFTAPASGQHEVTVHFASTDEDLGGRKEYRATDTDYQQPQAKPMGDTTMGNGAVDQKPQQPQ